MGCVVGEYSKVESYRRVADPPKHARDRRGSNGASSGVESQQARQDEVIAQ